MTGPPSGLCCLTARRPALLQPGFHRTAALAPARLTKRDGQKAARRAADCKALFRASFRTFHAPLPHFFRTPFAPFFRSWFDSSKAPKTVRWGRFQGLEFAPETRAHRACSAPFAGLPHLFSPTARLRHGRRTDALAPVRLPQNRTADCKARFRASFRAFPLTFPAPFLAPGLIAAKPVKPCDGGVFGALNLLLFLQQSAGAGGRC